MMYDSSVVESPWNAATRIAVDRCDTRGVIDGSTRLLLCQRSSLQQIAWEWDTTHRSANYGIVG